MAWRMARSLGGTKAEGLLGEINAYAPKRSKVSDGGIGDARHAISHSDHNPCVCCNVVCARDFTHDPRGGLDANILARWLRERALAGEQRIKYVIWNRRIMTGPGHTRECGKWRPYSGKNPHTKHLHISVNHRGCDDTTPWGFVADVGRDADDSTTPTPAPASTHSVGG